MSAFALGLPCMLPPAGSRGRPPSAGSSGGVPDVDGAEERVELDREAMLAAVATAGDRHLRAAGAAVGEEEDLHDAIVDRESAAHVLDDGAIGEHRPAAPGG